MEMKKEAVLTRALKKFHFYIMFIKKNEQMNSFHFFACFFTYHLLCLFSHNIALFALKIGFFRQNIPITSIL